VGVIDLVVDPLLKLLARGGELVAVGFVGGRGDRDPRPLVEQVRAVGLGVGDR
jgi:hypothetical protein